MFAVEIRKDDIKLFKIVGCSGCFSCPEASVINIEVKSATEGVMTLEFNIHITSSQVHILMNKIGYVVYSDVDAGEKNVTCTMGGITSSKRCNYEKPPPTYRNIKGLKVSSRSTEYKDCQGFLCWVKTIGSAFTNFFKGLGIWKVVKIVIIASSSS